MKTFDTVTDLSAAKLSTDQIVSVKEVGEYRVKASGSGITLANGNIAVPVPSGSTVNIKQFGAIDDGATDCNSAFDLSISSINEAHLGRGNYKVFSQIPLSTGTVITGTRDSVVLAEEGAGYGVGDAIFRANSVDNVVISSVKFNVTGGTDQIRAVTLQDSENSKVYGLSGIFTGRGTYPLFFVNDSAYHTVKDIDVEIEDYGILWKPQFADPVNTDTGSANYHTGSDLAILNAAIKGASTGDGGKIGISIDGDVVGSLIGGAHITGISDLLSVGEGFGIAYANESDNPEKCHAQIACGLLIKDTKNEALHYEDEMRSFGAVGFAIEGCGNGIRLTASDVATHVPPADAVTTDGVPRGGVFTGGVIDSVREEAIVIEGASHTSLGNEAHIFSNMVITNWNTDSSDWAAVWLPAEHTNSLIFSNLIFRDGAGDVFRINADHGGIDNFNNGPIIIENIIVHNVTGDVFDIVTTEPNDHIYIKSGSVLSGGTNVFSSTSSLNNLIGDRNMVSAQVTAGIAAGPTYFCERIDHEGYLLKADFIFEDANTATVSDFWKLRKRSAGGVTADVATFGVGTSGEAAFDSKDLQSSWGTIASRKIEKGDVFWIEKSGSAGDGAYTGRFEFNYFTYF